MQPKPGLSFYGYLNFFDLSIQAVRSQLPAVASTPHISLIKITEETLNAPEHRLDKLEVADEAFNYETDYNKIRNVTDLHGVLCKTVLIIH